MVREVNLLSYLPSYLQKYQEVQVTLNAEDPEFILVWNATDRTLYNEFIMTANEQGITRYEKMLGILSSTNDTLESRRDRILIRWVAELPYTFKMLIEKLIILCGENNFTITKDYNHYRINIDVSVSEYGKILELEQLVDEMIPCNMVVINQNKINCMVNGSMCIAAGVCHTQTFKITNDFVEQYSIDSENKMGSVIIFTDVLNSESED